MARTTAGKLVDRTVAAAKRVTGAAAPEDASSTTGTPARTPAKTPAKPVAKAAGKAPAKAAKAPAKERVKAPVKAPVKSTARKSAGGTGSKTTSNGAAEPAGTAKKAAVRKPAAKKVTTPAAAPAKQAPARKVPASRLAVKPDEKPWTASELAEVRGELDTDRSRLRSELNMAEVELHDLMRDAGDGAGNDQADVGSTTFERDHEMSLANNARDMLAQTERALARIEDGSYGVCESCGQPIGKMRVMAFPRATLCLSCKQREERR